MTKTLGERVKKEENTHTERERETEIDRVMPVSPPLSKSNAAGCSRNMQMKFK